MKPGKMVLSISAISAMWALAFVMAMAAAAPLRAAEDAARPAEFKVLDRWVGDWDVEMTMKPNKENPQGGKNIYRSVIRWAIADRFLHCEASGKSEDGKTAAAFMWIMTHDPQSKTYSSAVFWANVEAGTAGFWGGGAAGVGTWDEKEQMMSIRSEDKDGIVTLSVTQWIDKDTHRWAQSMSDKNGNVLFEHTGMGKRRK